MYTEKDDVRALNALARDAGIVGKGSPPAVACRLKVGSMTSVGVVRAKSDGATIYIFRVWDKYKYCGDGETLRATKAEAYADARAVIIDASLTMQYVGKGEYSVIDDHYGSPIDTTWAGQKLGGLFLVDDRGRTIVRDDGGKVAMKGYPVGTGTFVRRARALGYAVYVVEGGEK
jgi:hypothetical protein